MPSDGLFEVVIITATLLCSLVAGFLFAFAIVVMPGISKLNDPEFIKTFQEMDGVIQENQPVFLLVWVGSVVALLIAAGLSFGRTGGTESFYILGATVFYLVGVQLPTVVFNIPLNNSLQTKDIQRMEKGEIRRAREEFESSWNRWNSLRTIFACLTSVILILLLVKI
ncbi:MAG: DUF1772 domain-containing protein [Calditrichia bacterium]